MIISAVSQRGVVAAVKIMNIIKNKIINQLILNVFMVSVGKSRQCCFRLSQKGDIYLIDLYLFYLNGASVSGNSDKT